MRQDSFDFIREGDTFCWKGDGISVEFSEPVIEARADEYLYGRDEIRRMSYRMRVRVTYYDVVDGCWVDEPKVMLDVYNESGRTLSQLEDLLSDMLYNNDKPCEGWQCDEYEENRDIKECRLSRSTYSYDCADFYEITKIMNPTFCTTVFIVTVGTGYSYEDIHCFRLENLIERDMAALEKCIEEFYAYAIEHANKEIQRISSLQTSAVTYADGKLYFYMIDDDDNITGKLSDIFICGDRIEAIRSYCYDGYLRRWNDEYEETVAEINAENLVFESGLKYPVDKICYMRGDKEERRELSVEDIKSEFSEMMTAYDKRILSEKSVEEAAEIYGGVIRNRYEFKYETLGLIPEESDWADFQAAIDKFIKEIMTEIKEGKYD